jgi:isopenicillin N synthase-like dioxygenase
LQNVISIDVSQIDNPDAQLAIAREVTEACGKWGFLFIKRHKIPARRSRKYLLGKEFFSLPEEQKEPWPINRRNIGYVGSFKDKMKEDKMSTWFGGPPGSLSDNEALPPFWHPHSEKLEAFKHKCHGLIIKLLVYFALAMDLPDRNFFADAHPEDAGNGNPLRMIMYSASGERPPGTRMEQHTDSGSVTLLFRDRPTWKSFRLLVNGSRRHVPRIAS